MKTSRYARALEKHLPVDAGLRELETKLILQTHRVAAECDRYLENLIEACQQAADDLVRAGETYNAGGLPGISPVERSYMRDYRLNEEGYRSSAATLRGLLAVQGGDTLIKLVFDETKR